MNLADKKAQAQRHRTTLLRSLILPISSLHNRCRFHSLIWTFSIKICRTYRTIVNSNGSTNLLLPVPKHEEPNDSILFPEIGPRCIGAMCRWYSGRWISALGIKESCQGSGDYVDNVNWYRYSGSRWEHRLSPATAATRAPGPQDNAVAGNSTPYTGHCHQRDLKLRGLMGNKR
jgi:hypothetical protein